MNCPGARMIVKRNGERVVFDPNKITESIYRAAYSQGGHNRELASRLKDQVVALIDERFPANAVPTVDQVLDAVEKVLIENGHARTAKAFILYRNERDRLREENREAPSFTVEPVPYKKIWQVLNWNVEHHCETIAKLNQRIADGSFPDLVLEADAAYDADINQAAEAIIGRRGEIRLVIISGPSSSGKTTTTIKLAERLSKAGLRLTAMNLDNYFYDLHVHPRDEHGDSDFETPQALDLPLINEHLAALFAGETIRMPRFNFHTGNREPDTTPMRLEQNELVLIDSLHGLYDEMTKSVAPQAKFKLYIETLAQLKDAAGKFVRWTDIRLMRRMIRDSKHRNNPPNRTIEHWQYVRRSELRHIIPFIHTTDYILNGSLPYELPVLKQFLIDNFRQFITMYHGVPGREDVLERAERVIALFEAVADLTDFTCIPSSSLLREFIGGSMYKY